MRVCFVVESGTDVRLVDGLAERCELTVVARRITAGAEVSQPPPPNVRLDIGPASRVRFAGYIFGYVRARRAATDYVLVQGSAAAAASVNLASRLWNLPAAMLICSPAESYYSARILARDPERPFRRRELWGLRALARLNARLGRRYIVLSEYLAGVVRRSGARGPVSVVPVYGVDTEAFCPSGAPRAALRARRGLPREGVLMFFSSRIAPEKDAGTLLLAMRRLLDVGRDVRLLHRSGGYRELLAEARRAGVDSRVIATDAAHPRDLPDDYRACDVCVQASRDEGLGFSVLEAMACGTPVVAAAAGGLRETVLDGRTGGTYPPGDAPALAAAIAGVLDDPPEAARRATAGRALVAERYERQRVFDRLFEIIDSETGRSCSDLVRG